MPADKLVKPSSSDQGTPGQDEKALWTVMVYLAGDNNLADECVYALTEMKAAQKDPRIKVVAQFDPTARKIRTRRFVITGGEKPEPTTTLAQGKKYRFKGRRMIMEDILAEGLPEGTIKFPGSRRRAKDATGETDTGDPKTLFDFISWTVENHRAEHYMVILSGHGGGPTEQEFLRDEGSNGTLTIQELGEVFAAVRQNLKDKVTGKPVNIDIVGMDSCLMSMAEVCHELHSNVTYMISSESFGPQSGWPYGHILQSLNNHLASKNEASPEDVAHIVLNEHVDFYMEYAMTNGLSVDISLMNVSQADELAARVSKLAEVLIAELEADPLDRPSIFRDQLVLAHWEAQSYNGELFVDLYDFCDCLEKRYHPDLVAVVEKDDPRAEAIAKETKRRADVVSCCQSVKEFIQNNLVRTSCNMGVNFQYSFGVSIYFPWSEVAPDYTAEALSFVRTTNWRKFLDAYVEKTRRLPRGVTKEATKEEVSPVMFIDTEVRKTPQEDRGPAQIRIRSMRNPPTKVVAGGLTECTRAQFEVLKS